MRMQPHATDEKYQGSARMSKRMPECGADIGPAPGRCRSGRQVHSDWDASGTVRLRHGVDSGARSECGGDRRRYPGCLARPTDPHAYGSVVESVGPYASRRGIGQQAWGRVADPRRRSHSKTLREAYRLLCLGLRPRHEPQQLRHPAGRAGLEQWGRDDPIGVPGLAKGPRGPRHGAKARSVGARGRLGAHARPRQTSARLLAPSVSPPATATAPRTSWRGY